MASSPSGDASASAALAAASLRADASQTSQDNSADKTITLDSNEQFIDVMKEALDDKTMQTPQRIAIELQTPPGATVTVYFSQANGQLRAQLSASDSNSLQWLQQQVGSLKEVNGGSGVVWLPPQLDNSNGQNNPDQSQSRSAQQQQQNQSQAANGGEDMDDDALAAAIFGGIESA